MLHPLNTELRRQAVHESYVDQTLEVLERAQVVDAIGEQSAELAAAIRTSYVVPRDGYHLVVPPEQLDDTNVGVHPMLLHELQLPLWVSPSWLRPKYRHQLDQSYGERYDSWEDDAPMAIQAGRVNTVRRLAGVSPFNAISIENIDTGDGNKLVVADRPLILVRAAFMALTPQIVRSAIVAHEFDHANKLNTMFETWNDDALIRMIGNRALRQRQFAKLERTAYELTYRILATDKRLDDEPGIQAIADEFTGLSPAEAGRLLAKKCNSHRLPFGIQRFHTVSAGAMALTQVFGAGLPEPTEAEVLAYQMASLI